MSRASLTDRLAARALALAIQPEVGSTDSAAALGRLAGTDHDALHRALQRIERRHVDRPNPVADAAAQALRLALNTATPTQSSGIPPEVDISWIRREP